MFKEADNYAVPEKVEVHPVFSLQGLIAWLETQPPDKRYWYLSKKHCLLAQYFRAHGLHYQQPCPFSSMLGLRERDVRDDMESVGAGRPWKFGAALSRARALLGKGV